MRKKNRSGKPASDIGVQNKEYYLIVEEKTGWGDSAAAGRLKFTFKNIVKKVISALRMGRKKPEATPASELKRGKSLSKRVSLKLDTEEERAQKDKERYASIRKKVIIFS